MTIELNGVDIDLYQPEAIAARELVNQFFSNVKKCSKSQGSKTFYFTVLAIAYVLSEEYMREINWEDFSGILGLDARRLRELQSWVRRENKSNKPAE